MDDWLTVMDAANRRGVLYRVLFHAVERGDIYSRRLLAPAGSHGRSLWTYVRWADVEAWTPKPAGRPRGVRQEKRPRNLVTDETHKRFCTVLDGLEPSAIWPVRGYIPRLSRRDNTGRRDG